jgi:hypothetical protein
MCCFCIESRGESKWRPQTLMRRAPATTSTTPSRLRRPSLHIVEAGSGFEQSEEPPFSMAEDLGYSSSSFFQSDTIPGLSCPASSSI